MLELRKMSKEIKELQSKAKTMLLRFASDSWFINENHYTIIVEEYKPLKPHLHILDPENTEIIEFDIFDHIIGRLISQDERDLSEDEICDLIRSDYSGE